MSTDAQHPEPHAAITPEAQTEDWALERPQLVRSRSNVEGARILFLGDSITTVVDKVRTKLGLDNWVQEVVTGGIIVAAVVVDRLRQKEAT